ncbi:hypothetical protein E5676_scaffold162G00070 [Cucumis melo var. makuwa]|uniref:Uncharacterized protein n=1 Tax=Cucumis melo var. makuwa TaxID=1194695 RepID=A0A5D3DJG4_CUCMM|nr:hypothetical protein E5676_scaffold162G00070 [Cucumis melo var. makuwa]
MDGVAADERWSCEVADDGDGSGDGNGCGDEDQAETRTEEKDEDGRRRREHEEEENDVDEGGAPATGPVATVTNPSGHKQPPLAASPSNSRLRPKQSVRQPRLSSRHYLQIGSRPAPLQPPARVLPLVATTRSAASLVARLATSSHAEHRSSKPVKPSRAAPPQLESHTRTQPEQPRPTFDPVFDPCPSPYDSSDSTRSSQPDCLSASSGYAADQFVLGVPLGQRRPDFVPTGSHVARVREHASSWVGAEVRARASWRATRSDRGEP